MKRGQLYRVSKSDDNDPKKQRVFLIISRQELIDKEFSTDGKMEEVNTALRIALAIG